MFRAGIGYGRMKLTKRKENEKKNKWIESNAQQTEQFTFNQPPEMIEMVFFFFHEMIKMINTNNKNLCKLKMNILFIILFSIDENLRRISLQKLLLKIEFHCWTVYVPVRVKDMKSSLFLCLSFPFSSCANVTLYNDPKMQTGNLYWFTHASPLFNEYP